MPNNNIIDAIMAIGRRVGAPKVSPPSLFSPRTDVHPNQVSGWGMRNDTDAPNDPNNGTYKGAGFFGALNRTDDPDAVSSELSAAETLFDAPDAPSARRSFPLLVPTLTAAEIQLLLSGGAPTGAMYEKARKFAEQRIMTGRSPFAGSGEADVSRFPHIRRQGVIRGTGLK